MVQSAAKSPEQYLAELPPARREVVARVRELILANLPPGYEERMGWGMLCYEIPLARYPNTYNGFPLGAAALAAQKNAYSIYLGALYMFGEEWNRKFREAWVATGKRLDIGKGCIRFRRFDDLAHDLIGNAIAELPVDDYIRRYEEVRAGTAMGIRPVKRKAAKKATRETAMKSARPAKKASPAKKAARAKKRVARKSRKR